MKRKNFRYRLETFLIVIHIAAGLCLILYPTVSNILKNIAFQNNIHSYTTAVDALDEEAYLEYLASAEAYNRELAERGGPFAKLNAEDYAVYDNMLRIGGTDIMGYVVIEKINVTLPIYHGTSDEVLQNGTGHLEGTSLPVGGDTTHCVISGHRGLPSATLFTNLDRLVTGDTFHIRVLGETLTYEIDQIVAVAPNDWSELKMVEGMDYCTLLTCTPYAVNTHRMLVRGHRIETPEEALRTEVQWYQAVADQNWKLILLIAAAGVLLLAIITFIIVTLVRKHLRKKRSKNPT